MIHVNIKVLHEWLASLLRKLLSCVHRNMVMDYKQRLVITLDYNKGKWSIDPRAGVNRENRIFFIRKMMEAFK